MLLHDLFLASLTALSVHASILIVPKHEQFSGPIDQSSVNSDDEIVAELDYLQFGHGQIPSGLNLDCPNCPFAINGQGKDGADYIWQSYGVQSTIDVEFTTSTGALSLNGNPFLDSQMRDLHRDQSTTQSAYFPESQPDAYNGRLPITYDVKVVQVRTVQLEDGSQVEFYSIDIEILSLGGRKIDIKKVNVHLVKNTNREVANPLIRCRIFAR